jgi:hypothetical protein
MRMHEMNNIKLISGFIILCLFSLSGCLTKTEVRSREQWESALIIFERGKTTAEDVSDCFGSPQKEILGREKDRIWVYKGDKTVLALWFNREGILTEFRYNELKNPDKMKYARIDALSRK